MSEWLSTDEMSLRARAYLTIVSLRHLVTGILCFAMPRIFDNYTFDVIKHWAPLTVWGAVMISFGTVAIVAMMVGRASFARFAIILSLSITTFWAGAFITDAVRFNNHSGVAAALWAATWCALAAKDLILSAMPLRSPFEDLLSEDGR